MQTPRVLTASLLIFACAPKSADTVGDGGSSSSSDAQTDGAEATSATNTSPTTGPSTGLDPTTTAQTTVSASDDTGPSTTDITSTTTDTETGADTEGGGLFGACAAAGGHMDACEPGSVGPVEQWIEDCSSVPFDVSRACAPVTEAKWRCIATLSCEEAMKFHAGEPTSCSPQVEAAEVACVYQGCFSEAPLAGDSCEYSMICNGFEQSIFCEEDVCTCSENNVTVGDCPANGFCNLGTDELPAAVTACCGWMH